MSERPPLSGRCDGSCEWYKCASCGWRHFQALIGRDAPEAASDECCHGLDDICVSSGCLKGVPGGESTV